MASTPGENVALVRQFLTAVIAGEDTDAATVFLAEDVGGWNLVFGGREGQEAVTAFGERILAGADVIVDIADVIATENRVAVRAAVSGTHESVTEMVPAGESFEIACAWFRRIDDGRITELWSLPDGLGLMEQLGVIPEIPMNRLQIQPTDQGCPLHDPEELRRPHRDAGLSAERRRSAGAACGQGLFLE
jgi:ketosteroid isomerase-like protein